MWKDQHAQGETNSVIHWQSFLLRSCPELLFVWACVLLVLRKFLFSVATKCLTLKLVPCLPTRRTEGRIQFLGSCQSHGGSACAVASSIQRLPWKLLLQQCSYWLFYHLTPRCELSSFMLSPSTPTISLLLMARFGGMAIFYICMSTSKLTTASDQQVGTAVT